MSRNGSGEYTSVALEAAALAHDPFEPVLYDFLEAGMWEAAAEWLVEECKRRGWAEFRATSERALLVSAYLPDAYRMDHDRGTHYVLAENGRGS